MHSFQRQENILYAYQNNFFFQTGKYCVFFYKNKCLHLDVRLCVDEWAILLVCQQRRANEQRCFVLGRMYRKGINVIYIVSLIFFRTCLLPIFAAFLISSSSFFSSLSNSLSIKIMSQVHSFFKYCHDLQFWRTFCPSQHLGSLSAKTCRLLSAGLRWK